MSTKDNQLIGSKPPYNAEYVLDSMMDIDEWERDSAKHHKHLSERRKKPIAAGT